MKKQLQFSFKKPFAAICSFVFLSVSAFGQGMINNGAKLNVSFGTYLNIDNGGFTNESGGEVTNAGVMQVEGDWENNDAGGVFAAASGVVQLDGAAQNITGSEVTDFYNLLVDGTGHKTLVGVDANIDNNIHLNGASLRLNTNNLNIETASTTGITENGGFIISETGPASGGYGNVRWLVGTNTGNYTIPFGTDAASPADLTFQYNITTAGSPSSNYKSFATYVTDSENSFTGPNITVNPNPADWTDLPTGVQHLTDDYSQAAHYFTVDRFWIIDAENIGDGQSGYGGTPRFEYVFKYAQAEVAAPNHIIESNLVAQRYNHVEDRWGDWLYGVPAVINDPTNNEVTIQIGLDPGTVTEDLYPIWTLVDNSDPLPIELVRFIGQCNGDEITINWTTWTETNNDYFTVERSENGTDFEVVDVVEGAGNSNQPISYEVKDPMPFSGTSYYRLKDTDFAGKSTYSSVIAVTCGESVNDFEFINAYEADQTEVVVEFTATENEDYNIVLYDAAGRRVLEENGAAMNGMNKVRIPTGNLARGIYIVNLNNNIKNFSERVMLR